MSSISEADFQILSEAILQLDGGAAGGQSSSGGLQLDEIFLKWCGRPPDRKKFSRNHRKRRLSEQYSSDPELFTPASHPLHPSWPVTFLDARTLAKPTKFYFATGDSPFGKLLLISDDQGLRSMRFTADVGVDLAREKSSLSETKFCEKKMPWHADAVRAVGHRWSGESAVPLVFKGSEFQLRVWRSLAELSYGGLTTYGAIADRLELNDASRAVGTAVGANPWAGIIPCHRVVQSNGGLSGFAWGPARKAAMLAWEAHTI